MDVLTSVDRVYRALIKKLRTAYRTLALRRWVSRHSSGKGLTAEQEKEIKAFFKPYHSVTTRFHAYYTEKTGTYSVNYLPNDLYINYIDAFYNDAKKAVVLENKCYFKKMFPTLKQPEIVCYRLNRFWYTADDERIDFARAECLVAAEQAVVVKQAAGSSGGHDVTFLERGSETDLSAFSKVVSAISDDIIVQRPIRQHPQLAALNSSSVNSLRVVSLLREDDVKVYSSVLRMGVAGMKVDNEASGGVNCGVREDGTLRSDGHTKDSGKCYQTHPTSGVRFEGYPIPSYDKVIAAVEKAHPLIPHFRLVSWDFTVDEQGDPVFIEANLNCGGLHINQINNGPLFGDDTRQVLNEVFHSKH